MSIEEILAALQAVIDAAGDQPLTDEQAARYEELEQQLAVARRNQEIRSRQTAYTTPVRGDLHVHAGGSNRERGDTLERAFTHYLRTGKENQDLTELRAQSTSDAAGGYMIPSGFRQKLVEVTKAFGGLAAEADTYNTDTGNAVEFPSLDDTANSGSITTEASSFTSGADLTFGTVTLGAFKYTSMGTGSNLPLRVSVELAQDSAFDITALVTRALGTRIARAQAAHWCTGAGTTEPFGICRSGLSPDDTADVPPTIDYEDLVDLETLLDPTYQLNAKWLMNTNTWARIRKVLDGGATGRPLIFDQAASGMRTQPEKQLLGYTVVLDNAMPSVSGGAGRNCLVFGDLKQSYVIRQVQDVVIIVDPYGRATNGEIQYSAWARADGNVQNRSAYKILKA